MAFEEVFPVVLVLTKCLIIGLSVLFFLSGIDELFVDAYYFMHRGWERLFPRKGCAPVTEQSLLREREATIAVMIPAWQEYDVIQRMVENLRSSQNYGNFVIFVGTYPNDEKTQHAVEDARERFDRIERIVCPKDGPTNKADCLNWIFKGIQVYEKQHGVHFEVFVMDDSEDIVHPLAFKVINHYIREKDLVQLPVFPIPPRLTGFTAGHYVDEFAENHCKNMKVREWMTGIVPLAGVGCAFSRGALDIVTAHNKGQLFSIDSLTEDYDFAFTLRKFGFRGCFVNFKVRKQIAKKNRWTGRSRSVVAHEYVGIREHFPSALRAAVKQKSRWIVGIALQAWRKLGWQGSLATKYWFYRDRKGLFTNIANLLAYFIVLMFCAVWTMRALMADAYRYPPLAEPGTWVYQLLIINAVFLAERFFLRGYFAKQYHNWSQALVSAPRLIWSNVTNFGATVRALKLYAKFLWTGKVIAWDKTSHVFPSEQELVAYRRRLGDLLLDQRCITTAQLKAALQEQRQSNEKLGQILLRHGLLNEEQLIQIVATQLHVPVQKLQGYRTPEHLLHLVPGKLAVRYAIFPVALNAQGVLVLATHTVPRRTAKDRLERRLGRCVQFCLTTGHELRAALGHAYGAFAQEHSASFAKDLLTPVESTGTGA